jgi:hypothetical protein
MNRLPYEFVAPYAEQLFIQVVSAPEWDTMSYLKKYFSFLSFCGWTSLELDQEMLAHIDATWNLIIRNQNKIRRIGTALN